ncbi:MAG: PAS domain S-box protein [Deferribacterales bacterium]
MKGKLESNSEFNKFYFDYLKANPFLPVIWIDADGQIFNVNDAACGYLGYSRDDITRSNITSINTDITPEQLPSLVDIIRKHKIYRFESHHRRKDGAVLDVEIISSYYSIDGQEFFINYVFDISEKKQHERQLENMVAEKTRELRNKIDELEISEKNARLNEELFINAFKTSQDAINLNDTDKGTYIQVNDGFVNIMGYSADEVIGKSSLDLNIWKDPQDRMNLVGAVKKYGFCHNYEADFVRKDGTIVHGLMSASIQEYQGKKVMLNVSKDITQIKKLENQMKELNSQLQTRVEQEVAIIRRQQEIIFEQKKLADMGMMINAIAHQWRQPLNIIGLRTQELADTYRDGLLTDEFIDDFEEQQMDTVAYLSSTIDDFRTFFKPDDKESEFDVSGEIIGLLKLIEIQMLTKGIKVFISYTCGSENIDRSSIGDFPRRQNGETAVKGYKGEFKQVLTNLIYNSIFALEDKIKITGKQDGFIHIRICKSEHRVRINVEDNGGGIPDDVMPHIFNPYFTTKSEGKGTGLGLYLAKLIIETHMKGEITVRNTDSGADFEIILPSVK